MIVQRGARIIRLATTALAFAGLGALARFFQSIPVLISHGCREKREIAMTFDADMLFRMQEALRAVAVEEWYDSRITSILEKESVPATFFISGLWAENYPDVVRRLSETPAFEIGNHSYDHAAFSWPCYNLPPVRDKTAEVTRTQEILRKITGRTPIFFRFPGGCSSAADVVLIYFLGLRAVGWDVNSMDAFSNDGEKIVEHTLATTRNGSIIVMHLSGPPNAPKTALVLPSLIKGLRERGFSFVTISRLLAHEEGSTLFPFPFPAIGQRATPACRNPLVTQRDSTASETKRRRFT
jgi:peptidoglycan/xylan/chitin deacetylase (PgdA/CDA1 family)